MKSLNATQRGYFLVTGYGVLVSGYWILDTGNWLLDAGFWIQMFICPAFKGWLTPLIRLIVESFNCLIV